MKKWYWIIWIFLIYFWVLLFVNNTSENTSYKNKNIINNVSAELNFYQSTINNAYENWIWSSEKFPIQTVFEKVKVTLKWEPEPADTAIKTINITRHSH